MATTHRVHELPELPFTPARDDAPAADGFRLTTSDGDWAARAVVSATGTWTRPFVRHHPGHESFAGQQLHTAGYRGPEEFTARHVVVIRGSASAVQLLGESSAVTSTTWVTRRPPVWREGPFREADGRAAVGHLAPLHVRRPSAGARRERASGGGQRVLRLVRHGPSASTIGTNRAGQAAARALRRQLHGPAAVAA